LGEQSISELTKLAKTEISDTQPPSGDSHVSTDETADSKEAKKEVPKKAEPDTKAKTATAQKKAEPAQPNKTAAAQAKPSENKTVAAQSKQAEEAKPKDDQK